MTAAPRRVLGLVLAPVLVVFAAQQLLTPVFAPLAREVGLRDWQLGLVMTVGAITFTAASPIWGSVCERVGYRQALVYGLVLAAAGLAGFAATSGLAWGGELSSGGTLTAMLATRSLLFGVGVAAIPVAALAYVSATSDEVEDRTKAVSLVGAMQGLALVLGPAVGGGLAAVELLAPVYLAPVLVAVLAGVIAIALPRAPRRHHDDEAPSGRLRFWDPRLRPWLTVGFFVYLSLGLVQVILGFVYQDRLGTDAEATAGAVGAAGFLTGLVLVATQAALVPRLRWAPRRLLRAGTPVAMLGFAGLGAGQGFWAMTAAMMVVALGLGLAMPGFTAGATLAVEDHRQQGRIAGLISATTGATFVVGPLLGTLLYERVGFLPMAVAAGCCVIAWIYSLTNPRLQASAPRPAPHATEPAR